MVSIDLLLNTFYRYTLDIFPYFILASFLTSLIQAYLNLNILRSILGNSKLAPLFTASFGALLPECSCSMIPVAHLINNLSKSYSPVIAYLMVAPILSPITVLLTYGFFGLELTVIRVFGTIIFALVVAYTVGIFFKKEKNIHLRWASNQDVSQKRFTVFLKSLRYNLLFTGRYILTGIAIASMIKALVPTHVASYVAGSPLSYPLISLVSTPIYVCSGEDVPIAKALTHIGFTHGNALTFMLASSGTCLPTIFAVKSFLPIRIIFIYVLSWFIFSSLLGFIFDLLF
ncbi:permease [Hydrogenobacter hydrogenophilus]|uniref:Permease n=1 Tax=Hydrogenobacter hydrogenophilus TaxID=35835 RepID=A0A285NMT5_9AQUI|nr:permease [Hydrogenobacter hydrogenophilus]SNZ10765.1 hypothetical protein SAMN06265353_0043 [Hydrogenobacter hydrogenophilus]